MDRPILFSAPMVRALLDGRKTQTRRVLGKAGHCNIFEPGVWSDSYVLDPGNAEWRARDTPFSIGDRLWVKETTRFWSDGHDCEITYLADGTAWQTGPNTGAVPDEALPAYFKRVDKSQKLRGGFSVPSIFLTKWASRLTLLVTDVRVERLNDCTEADAIAEGLEWVAPGKWAVDRTLPIIGDDPRRVYAELWDRINGAGAWEANPWVVAVSFEVHRGNIDTLGRNADVGVGF